MSLASTEAIVTHYLLEFRELGVGMKLSMAQAPLSSARPASVRS